MLDNEKLLFDEIYEKTKDCGRVQFVELLMTKERENKELKLQLKGTTHCFDEEEHEKLKKQVEEYQQELEKADSITQSCIFNGKEESKISYRKCLNILDKKEAQQKEFIKYLEDEINKLVKEYGNYVYDDYSEEKGKYDSYQEILQKYKEIIGDDK